MKNKQEDRFMIRSELTEFVNEPFDVYIGNDHFASGSMLKKYKRSPLHKIGMIDKMTEAKEIGRIYHEFLLEPLSFQKNFIVIDDREKIAELSLEYKNPRSSNKYKDWYFEQTGGQDLTPIFYHDFCRLNEMKTVLFNNPFARYLVEKSQVEISAYGIIDGVLCKGRFDMLIEKKRWIADLKTVRDASYLGFQGYLKDFDGHLQPAQYTQLAEQYLGDGMPWKFFWIAQEKIPPYAVGIYQASAQLIAVGAHELGLLLAEHKFCEENKQYDGYEVFVDNEFGIREIDFPHYAIKDYQFYNKKK